MSWIRRTLLTLLLGPFLLVGLHMMLFRVLPVPLTPLMVIRWNQDQPIEKTWRSIEEISPHLARAVIASEDNRFCAHSGVDWSAVKAVVEEYRDEGRLRGASTISMQTAKNLYLWPGRSVVRKALEAGLVYVLEWAWPKERIMEVYLNIVELGPGIYGAQAAAQHHFGRDASELSLVQSAALASILPDPLHRDPTRRNKAMGIRVERIRQSLRELGPLLDCVATPPPVEASSVPQRSSVPESSLRSKARSKRMKAPSGLGGAPQHFQPLNAESQDDAAPQEPRRGKHKKLRSKRGRRPR